MAQAVSHGSGTATIAASAVAQLLRDATGLPSTFFVNVTKARVLTDGSLETQYTFSTESAPPPPTAVAAEETP